MRVVYCKGSFLEGWLLVRVVCCRRLSLVRVIFGEGGLW